MNLRGIMNGGQTLQKEYEHHLEIKVEIENGEKHTEQNKTIVQKQNKI